MIEPQVNKKVSGNRNFRTGLFMAFISIVMLSCDPNRVFEENVHIKGSAWNLNDPVIVETEIFDTVSPLMVYFNIRHNNDYRYSNLYLFVDTYFPNDTHRRDTIECMLADPSGKWYGKGLGDIREIRILVMNRVVFPMAGMYRFQLQQAMRVDDLEGIEDVGIRIEKMQE